MMPGNRRSPARSLHTRLSRISCFTGRERYPDRRRSPRVSMAAMTRFYQLDSLSVRHPFFASPRPLVFAHRGGSGLAPENTIAAFDTGLALGVDGLELDVRLSRDGIVVVHHDASLDRTTDVRAAVSARTAAELSQVDAGYRFTRHDAHPFRGRGFGVP